MQSPPQVPVKKKGHLIRNVGIVVGALLVVGIGVAIASSGGSNNNTAGTTTASSPAVTAAATAKATAAATAKAPAGPILTNQQKNAAKSAQSYLNLMGFSRQGLINQLSSAAEGYSVQDATIAVDSLKVDWNAQAVRSAKEYLSTMAFSCNGLIQQLDSSAEGYTVAQATYGAQQAGAC